MKEIRHVAVIGLGYVGLPLAVHLARAAFSVVGVDINRELASALMRGERPNKDLPKEVFPIPRDYMLATTTVPSYCDVYIVAVPTPDLGAKGMDSTFVVNACREIGEVMPDDSIIVVESTVTPGSTMGLLRETVMQAKGDSKFHIAFSPERVNPGSMYFYEMGNTEKLVGAPEAAREVLYYMYRRIFEDVVFVGVEEAELAKAFENMQRDVNIALMNELALCCEEKGLKYDQVIEGLRTKKTSPVFTSGLVGGHCIPVDPYFLSEYYSDPNCLALHGRMVNEDYIYSIANRAIDYNDSKGKVLIIGKTYKSGVVDTRNSGSLKLLNYLKADFDDVVIHDILLDPPYEDGKPSLIIGTVNHNPNLNVYEYYAGEDSKCVFINIGGRFTKSQTDPFKTAVEL